MGINKKSTKGEISIENFRGKIRLRWRYKTSRPSLTLPYPYTEDHLLQARIIAAEVKLDILKGCYDPTLEKYRVPDAEPENSPLQQVSTPTPITEQVVKIGDLTTLGDLVSLFEYWGANIRSIDVENTSYYFNAKRLLVEWSMLPIDDIPAKLHSQKFAPTTFNDRLTCLKLFFAWLAKKKKIANNPLEEVVRRKKRRKLNDSRRPLSEDEIIQFLTAIKEDTYCPSASRFKHSYYYPFFYFIFLTGVRNAEAIGLRVKHINLRLNNIEISETFARTRKGTNHAARVRKGTKTENVRYLPLDGPLKELVEDQIIGKKPDDFVFPSQTGLSIDDHRLQTRIYKPVMVALGFGNRDLYAARHSFGTRSIEQGISPTSTAYAMGHATIDTVIRNYVAVVKPSTELPKIVGKGN